MAGCRAGSRALRRVPELECGYPDIRGLTASSGRSGLDRPANSQPWHACRVNTEHGEEESETGERPQAQTLGLARQLATELADVATVQIDSIEGGITVTVTPHNSNARAFMWADFSDEMVLQVGDFGGRWELEAVPEDIALFEDIVRSVIAGRVREVFALDRSAVSVTLADGSVATEIGGEAPLGCLPLPFWRRWSRSIQYAPYEPGGP